MHKVGDVGSGIGGEAGEGVFAETGCEEGPVERLGE